MVFVGNLREGDYLEEPCVDGRIMLKSVFETWDGRHRQDRCGSA